ncbi:hypothetical protein ACJX0J_024446, partial [Zea mays]
IHLKFSLICFLHWLMLRILEHNKYIDGADLMDDIVHAARNQSKSDKPKVIDEEKEPDNQVLSSVQLVPNTVAIAQMKAHEAAIQQVKPGNQMSAVYQAAVAQFSLLLADTVLVNERGHEILTNEETARRLAGNVNDVPFVRDLVIQIGSNRMKMMRLSDFYVEVMDVLLLSLFQLLHVCESLVESDDDDEDLVHLNEIMEDVLFFFFFNFMQDMANLMAIKFS